MEGGIIVFNGVDKVAYRNLGIQFFPDLSFQCLLRGFTRLEFAAWDFPSVLLLAVAAGGGINFIFRLNIFADDSCDNANHFHENLLNYFS